MPTHVVALSGGKDSTAMALRLAELHPAREFFYFCTPTGDELPEMVEHWARLERMLDRPLLRWQRKQKDTGEPMTLHTLIDFFDALPNWRQRWCTRMLKIEPCLQLMKDVDDPVLYVGLRADEEARLGIYSEDIKTVFPMREWGWGIREVLAYLDRRGVSVPTRTDCARCYYQRLHEWYDLWRDHPDVYTGAVRQEEAVSAARGEDHSFRSPSRDTWPASLAGLREEFLRGRIPRGVRNQLGFDFGMQWEEDEQAPCRVCSL